MLHRTKCKSGWHQKAKRKPNQNPDTLCYYGRRVGGASDCSCETDTAACQVIFHNIYCKMIERPWVQAAINLLPLLPLDHFAINCRSFKRFKLQFSQNKTIILSYLKMQGCGQKRLVIIMPSYWVVCKRLHTSGTIVAEDALLHVTLTGFTGGYRMIYTRYEKVTICLGLPCLEVDEIKETLECVSYAHKYSSL